MYDYNSRKIAFFDQYGNNLTGFVYDRCSHYGTGMSIWQPPFEDGVAMVSQKDADGNDLHGYIDLQGKQVVPCDIVSNSNVFTATRAHNGLIWTYMDGKYGLRDVTGREVLPCTYLQIAFWGDDYIAAIPSSGGIIVYDLQGNELGRGPGSGLYTNATNWGWTGFHEGLCAFTSGGKAGYMNTKGEVVIEPQYNTASSFSEGRAKVNLNGEVGVIDTAGNVVVPFGKYDRISDFSHGVASVQKS